MSEEDWNLIDKEDQNTFPEPFKRILLAKRLANGQLYYGYAERTGVNTIKWLLSGIEINLQQSDTIYAFQYQPLQSRVQRKGKKLVNRKRVEDEPWL